MQNLKKAALTVCLLMVGFISANAQDATEEKPAPSVEESKAFLEKNKTAKDVIVTESGLEYKVIKEGKGAKPVFTDRVTLHYSFSYTNGRKFLQPFDAENPWVHHIDKALPGMQEALPMMTVGSKWVLYMPASLALGDEGFDEFPGGMPLVCELELISIGEK